MTDQPAAAQDDPPPRRGRPHSRRAAILGWGLYLVWFGLIAGGLLVLIGSGEMPVDLEAYNFAAGEIAEGRTPYTEPALIHEKFRQISRFLIEGVTPAEGEAVRNPYIYPPTLATIMAATGNHAEAFVLALYAAMIGFALLWLRAAGPATPLWLLLCVFSWDLAANLSGGNAEILVLFLALLGCRALWLGWAVPAGLAMALAVLVKPFYLLFFAAFALVPLRQSQAPGRTIRLVAAAAVTALIVIGLEIWRWPHWLRLDALDYLRHAHESTFLVMALADQVPMSGWNRAPVQVLWTLGLPLFAAQAAALALWAGVVGLSAALVPRRSSGFALAFALAYASFLFARPTTWALPYFDVVVLLAVWPWLARGWERRLALAAAVVLSISHWAALGVTLAGIAPALLSLQTAAYPLETLIVLPGALALVLFAMRRAGFAPAHSAAPRLDLGASRR